MAKLSKIQRLIEAYIGMKGDKDVTSIGTVCGTDTEYVLHLHDVYEGPVGENPYSGKDTINIPKNGYEAPDAEPVKKGGAMAAYFKLEERLRRDTKKPLPVKLAMLWGALTVINYMGECNADNMHSLWGEFARDGMSLD